MNYSLSFGEMENKDATKEIYGKVQVIISINETTDK